MPKKLFALIKWVDGDDDGKYTVGIDTQWIKEFDYDKFTCDLEDPNKVYVIEWRKKGKEPLGGWPCYTGIIISVSHSVVILEKKLAIFNGIQSPIKVVDRDVGLEEPKNAQNNESKIEKRAAIDKKNDEEKSINASKRLSFGTNNVDGDNGNVLGEVTIVKEIIPSTDEVQFIETFQTGVSKNLLNVFVTKDDLKEALDQALKNCRNKEPGKFGEPSQWEAKSNHASVASTSSRGQNGGYATIDQKEIGNPGSKVFIDMSQWNVIKSKPTFTAMTRALLIAAFDTETLLRSNYKGGKSKVPKKDDDSVKCEALDPKIIKAIRETVQNKFRNTFNEGKFGSEINNKIQAIKREARLQQVRKQNQEEKNKENEQENN